MRITIVRRITQTFFLILFLWFCICATPGKSFWQLGGWPVNWFLQLDPLIASGTILTTRTLYAGLLWAVLTVALTAIFGRFFCGWVCPFGTLHHLVGRLGSRGRSVRERIALNRYRESQKVKYYVLLVLLAAASGSFLFKLDGIASSSLMTGLLDPIPLVYRSVNFLILPLADSSLRAVTAAQRHYEGAGLLAALFVGALLLNLAIPRFYCRFLCPLGALYGVLGRFALWRPGKKCGECSGCGLCNTGCEGACDPAGTIRTSECVLCFNCLDTCKDNLIGYNAFRSASGEIVSPDLSRRGFVAAAIAGIAAVPLLRLEGGLGTNYDPALIRPPGSLPEPGFLDRCTRCGQCARVCPTNVIQLDSPGGGIEGLWTPVLNMRMGTSGCQKNCTACGHVCPTGAIRPISLNEKLGLGAFRQTGPIRIGTAFVDRGRCLPWAMNRPCIVCQETCPVSPKAIYVKESFAEVRNGRLEVRLQAPVVDPARCTGCGVCEHECPVSGLRAIRVSAEGESRSRKHALLL